MALQAKIRSNTTENNAQIGKANGLVENSSPACPISFNPPDKAVRPSSNRGTETVRQDHHVASAIHINSTRPSNLSKSSSVNVRHSPALDVSSKGPSRDLIVTAGKFHNQSHVNGQPKPGANHDEYETQVKAKPNIQSSNQIQAPHLQKINWNIPNKHVTQSGLILQRHDSPRINYAQLLTFCNDTTNTGKLFGKLISASQMYLPSLTDHTPSGHLSTIQICPPNLLFTIRQRFQDHQGQWGKFEPNNAAIDINAHYHLSTHRRRHGVIHNLRQPWTTVYL